MTLIFPSAARLAGGNTDFDSQVKELIRTSPPTDCERGPGATMLCNENEFCKLDKSSTCPSTEYRRFTGTCVPAGLIPCPAIWDPVWYARVISILSIFFFRDFDESSVC